MNAGRKICILSTVHTSHDIRVFYKESRTLAKAGYNVILIIQSEKNEVREGVTIVALPSSKNRLKRITLSSVTALRLSLRQRADVYHLQDPELMPAGVLLKVLTGKKVVYDVHEDLAKDMMSKDWIPRPLRKVLALGSKAVERLCCFFFDAIVTATDDIQKNFRRNRRSVAVRNFPAFDFPEPLPRANDGTFKIIYLGLLSPERGISEDVKAMEFLDCPETTRLVLCGDYSPLSYEDQVRSLPGYMFVEHIGWVDPKEARLIMGQADVGLVCYLPEENHLNAMPNKLFEYMIAGIPVLCSHFPLWKEIVEGNRCGLTVDPQRPDEIAQAIEYLKAHPEVRAEMAANGKRIVLEKYNWNKEAEKLLRLYDDLLKRPIPKKMKGN